MIAVGAKITATFYVDVVIADFVNRVLTDGGTVEDSGHSTRTWEAVSAYSPSLFCPCNAGKVSTLYSLVV